MDTAQPTLDTLETVSILLDRQRELRLDYYAFDFLSMPVKYGGGGIDNPLGVLDDMLVTDTTVDEAIALEAIEAGNTLKVVSGPAGTGVVRAETAPALDVPSALNAAQEKEPVRYATTRIRTFSPWAITTMAWAAMRFQQPTLTRTETATIIQDALAAGTITLGEIVRSVKDAFLVGGVGGATRKNVAAAPATQ